MPKGGEGLNYQELQEHKAALLKAERLELLLLLRDSKSIEEAIELIEQRLKA